MFGKYLMFGNYLRICVKVCVDLLHLTNLKHVLFRNNRKITSGSVHRQDFYLLKLTVLKLKIMEIEWI